MRAGLIVLAAAALAAVPGGAAAQDARDRDTLLATITHWDMAWATKDAVLGAFDYADDADWADAAGRRAKGRAAVQAALAATFAAPAAAAPADGAHAVGGHAAAAHDVRFLGADVAVVHSRGGHGDSHLRVYQRRAGRWQIVTHHVSGGTSR